MDNFVDCWYHSDDGLRLYARDYDSVVANYTPVTYVREEREDSGAIPPDLWPVFDSVCSIPMLVVRGALSDIPAADCVEAMRRRKPDLQVAEIPHRGHAPTLTEPASPVAVEAFLGQ